MSTTIIYAHPYEKSFNAAILAQVEKQLSAKGESYQVIDLYADGFNPAYTAPELALYKQGKSLDPLVGKYQEILKNTHRLIFVFPVWWGDVPAIIKGFADKTLLGGFAFDQNPKNGMIKGKLTHIEEALVITTSTSPTFVLKLFCGNGIGKVFSGYILKSIGIKKRTWLNCARANLCPPEKRQAFLDNLGRHI